MHGSRRVEANRHPFSQQPTTGRRKHFRKQTLLAFHLTMAIRCRNCGLLSVVRPQQTEGYFPGGLQGFGAAAYHGGYPGALQEDKKSFGQ